MPIARKLGRFKFQQRLFGVVDGLGVSHVVLLIKLNTVTAC